TLIFPCASVAVEYVNTVIFGSWGAIPYSQVDNLPLLQIASVTGMWGITFLIAWTASCVAFIWEDFEAGRSRLRLAAAVGATLIAVLMFGGLRLAFAPDGPTTTVVTFTAEKQLVTIREAVAESGHNGFADLAKADRARYADVLEGVYPELFQRTKDAASPGVSIVMWPEEGMDVLEEVEPAFLDSAGSVARQTGAYLLLAYRVLPVTDPTHGAENVATLVGPDGTVRFRYLKTYPVPGVTERPGDGRLPLEQTPFGLISTAICYDMDFTGLIHQAGRAGVDLMLVPAWDWRAIDPLHARMASVRAVENGFSMVRETGAGRSVAVDPFGRVLAEKDYFSTPYAAMVAHVPAHSVWTVYGFVGDFFAWMCVAGFVYAALVAVRRRNQVAPNRDPINISS
ncbi:MAG: apolipoprotein N-acyltransferase, partial [Rhodothermales bacterium]|nr:apolipoprotein N-acyltransferase [Rhodothermales bacterium]